MSIPRLPVFLALSLFATLGDSSNAMGCPGRDEVLATIHGVDPARGSRTTRFHVEPPTGLYERAAGMVGKPMADRDGKSVRGVLLIDRPIETVWKALNDEPHHALDGRYLPLRHSEVIEGTPRGQERTLFQYFKKAGVGRWWVSRVEMNGELFAQSKGKIWEVFWEDEMDSVDPEQSPINSVSEKMTPLRESYGAWFIVPINGSCTLIEYYNHTEPGGFVSFAQALLAKSAVRDTLEALIRLGDEHLSEPNPEEEFIRPDGTSLD